MKIVVLGANGQIGKPIALEAAERGHAVIGVTRSSHVHEFELTDVKLVHGDATDDQFLKTLIEGVDVVVDAMRPPNGHEESLVSNTLAVARACDEKAVKLVVSGGAGGLKVDNDENSPLVIESEYVQDPWRAIAEASTKQYQQLFSENLMGNGVYVAAPAMLFDGPKIGNVRKGTHTLIKDENGDSSLSWLDFAAMIVDEIESPSGQRRLTGAY